MTTKNIISLIILSTLVGFVLFSFKNKNENLARYFINPNLGELNYRTFRSNGNPSKNILFKQKINKKKNGTIMEYSILTYDSIPYQGGIELITNNQIRILEQYLYLDNRKIKAHKLNGTIWSPFSEQGKMITSEFLDKKTGFGFKCISKAFSRFKDTLNNSAFIVDFYSKTIYLKNGKEFDKVDSEVKRVFIKDKGLIYFRETIDNTNTDYYLVEN